MKLEAYKHQLDNNPERWLKRAGYAMIQSRESNQASFVRRLSADFYPRFHIYLDQRMVGNKEIIIISLHLDQKKPGYAGQNRHNAEYDGEVVENEAKRLAQYLHPANLS